MDPILTPDQLMEKYIEVYRKKNADYGASFEKFGEILAIMCPDGVHLDTIDKLNAFGVFGQMLHKMNRYANLVFGIKTETNFEGAHDTAADMSVYSAMLDFLTLAMERTSNV